MVDSTRQKTISDLVGIEMGDDRVCRSVSWNSCAGQVTRGNAPYGDMDCLLVLANSAELMSRCDGNFDVACRINQSNEDRMSIGECLDEMHISEYVSENDGFHSQGNDLTCLNEVQHQTPNGNDYSLVQERNGEHLVEPLLRKTVRLTQIKRQARSKHCLLEKQMVGECEYGVLNGKDIRLTKLRRLARSKDARIWAKKLELVNSHTSEDDQRESVMARQHASEAICQLNCVLSEVETIHEYDMWDGANQPDGQMWRGQIENSGTHACTSQPPNKAKSGTSLTSHQIAQVVSDYGELKEQHYDACQQRTPSTSKLGGKLRERHRGQHVPLLELTTFSYGLNAKAENKMKCTKGSSRSSNLKHKARSAKFCN